MSQKFNNNPDYQQSLSYLESGKKIQALILEREELKKQLLSLAELYKFKFDSETILILFGLNTIKKYFTSEIQYTYVFELIEMIEFLSSCNQNEIRLSGIVSSPMKNEILAQNKKCVIKTTEIKNELLNLMHLNLKNEVDKLNNNKFVLDVAKKENLLIEDEYGVKLYRHAFYTEHFDKAEIDKIRSYIKTESKKQSSKNQFYGSILYVIYDALNSLSVFNSKKNNNIGISKEYQFLYDVLVVLGIEAELYSKTDKYLKIRDWIRTFQNS